MKKTETGFDSLARAKYVVFDDDVLHRIAAWLARM